MHLVLPHKLDNINMICKSHLDNIYHIEGYIFLRMNHSL